jgi:hypothetical protein
MTSSEGYMFMNDRQPETRLARMNTKELFEKLDDFSREDEYLDYRTMAEESFWNDIIDMTDAGTVDGLSRFLEPDMWCCLSACLLAFFSSNEYQQDPDPHAPRWNLVERFLALHGKALQSDEKGVLSALRDSHMSIYRVVRTDGATLISARAIITFPLPRDRRFQSRIRGDQI